MEHLPLPHDPLPAIIEVPYVCTEQYDKEEFLTYPARKGRPLMLNPIREYAVHERMFPSDKEELGIFLQTWLFFGLIHAMLGDLCNPEDFVTADIERGPPRRRITTAKLQALTAAWTGKMRATEKALSKPIFLYLSQCIELAWNTLNSTRATPIDHGIRVSIAATVEFLASILDKAHLEAEPEASRVRKPLPSGFYNEAIKRHMQDANWCASDILRIEEKFNSVQMVHYLSRMKRPETFNHRSCEGESCHILKGYLLEYQTRHRRANCSCAFVGVNQEAAIDILEKGSYPVVQIVHSPDDGEAVSLIMESREKVSSFVALSHVWVDGLGNEMANSLPTCQLLYISNILNHIATACHPPLSQSPYFWIDTLCCPRSERGRNLAIARMRRTYSENTHCLILDSTLTDYSSAEVTRAEASSRILTSPWMRRLWTLQEGALSKNMWFQFKDAPINFGMMALELMQMHQMRPEYRRLLQDMINDYGVFQLKNFMPETSIVYGFNLGYLDRALSTRVTSKKNDEGICIATLLGLDVEKVVEESAERRMCAMWSLIAAKQPGIPKMVIFLDEETLPFPGYRWAPATLLDARERWGAKHRVMCWIGDCGTLTPRGLLATYSAFRLNMPEISDGLPHDPWHNLVPMDEIRFIFWEKASGVWWHAAYTAVNTAFEQATPLPLETHTPLFELAGKGNLGLVLNQEASNRVRKPDDDGFRIGMTVTIADDKDSVLNAKLGKRIILVPAMASHALCYETAKVLAAEVRSDSVTHNLNRTLHEGSESDHKIAQEAVKAKIKELVNRQLKAQVELESAVMSILGERGHATSLWALVANWYRQVGEGVRVPQGTTWCID